MCSSYIKMQNLILNWIHGNTLAFLGVSLRTHKMEENDHLCGMFTGHKTYMLWTTWHASCGHRVHVWQDKINGRGYGQSAGCVVLTYRGRQGEEEGAHRSQCARVWGCASACTTSLTRTRTLTAARVWLCLKHFWKYNCSHRVGHFLLLCTFMY